MSERIEIEGQQFEVDDRIARRVETLKIGTPVRVLTKADYSGKRDIFTGVVVGFEPFKDLPTVRVAYFKADYSAASVEFVSFNAQTKDFLMVAAPDNFDATSDLDNARKALDRKVEKAAATLREAEAERDYFARHLASAWQEVAS